MTSAAPASQARPGGQGGRHQRQLVEGPITKTLLVFSLPMLGGNVLQSLNGSVNQFWVSHTLGISAITAIANSTLVMMMMLGSIFGISMAANILVAQAVGAGDLKTVKKVMGTAVTFFMILAVLIGAVGYFAAPTILHLMGTPAVSKAEAEIYLRIVFLAMPFMCLFAFLQMAQRGAGDSKTPFYFLVLAIVLDICLNPMLIRGIGPFPRLGIAGSACSTLIGQGVSLVCLIVTLYRMKSPLMLRWEDLPLLKPDLKISSQLLLRGLPMGFQMLIMSGAAMVMMGFVNSFGALTSAAYAAASQVWTYVQMPGMALGASISSMAAQNIGADRWDRVSKIAISGVLSSLAITGSIALAIYLAGDATLHLFLPSSSPAMAIAHHINQTVLWSLALFSITFALSGIVRSTGAVIVPLLILAFSVLAIRIPFAMVLIPHWGSDAIWWSFPLGTIVSAGLSALYYQFGGWRKVRMLKFQSEPAGEASGTGMGTPVMDVPIEDDLAEEAEVERAARQGAPA
ncbi:MAG TPA: MATE family efflux transporter [Caulobacteraceae bacterium]